MCSNSRIYENLGWCHFHRCRWTSWSLWLTNLEFYKNTMQYYMYNFFMKNTILCIMNLHFTISTFRQIVFLIHSSSYTIFSLILCQSFWSRFFCSSLGMFRNNFMKIWRSVSSLRLSKASLIIAPVPMKIQSTHVSTHKL